MPKFSIIIPVYNCKPYLTACVQSVLHQSCGDFELILVDDGATDGSGLLCDELAQIDPRIRVLHKSNGGAASARNAGLDAVTGAYVLFFDGDDTVEPNCLEEVTAALEQHDVDLLIFGMKFDYYQDQHLVRSNLLAYPHEGWMTREQMAEELLTLFSCNALSSACNKVFSARLLHALRYREGMTLYEDFDFVLRALARADGALMLPAAYYHYRIAQNEKHLRSRLADVERLRKNLHLLSGSMKELESAWGEIAAAPKLMTDLYLQLLDRNLLEFPGSNRELSQRAACILSDEGYLYWSCRQPEMQNWLAEHDHDGAALRRHYTLRRTKRTLRRGAKRILQALGWRRGETR